VNHQPAQRPNRVTAIFEHARIAFDMARGVTLAQLAEQLATLGEIHGGLPLSIDVQMPVDASIPSFGRNRQRYLSQGRLGSWFAAPGAAGPVRNT
jgi:hypothetical protein